MLEVMADPELAALYGQPPLSDLRTLAGGFRDLAVTAATPPPLPAAAAAPVVPPPAAPPMVVPPRVYTSADPEVSAPQVIRHDLPNFMGQVLMAKQGAIEVTIDESGSVEEVRMRQSVSPPYDAQAVKAALN